MIKTDDKGVNGGVGNSVLPWLGLLLLKYFWKAVNCAGGEERGGAVVSLVGGRLQHCTESACSLAS